MPRVRPKFGPEDLVVAVEPFTGDMNGEPFVVNPSEPIRANHPAVQRWPDRFYRYGDRRPVPTIPRFRDPSPPNVGRSIDPADAVYVTDDFRYDNARYERGMACHRNDAVVRKFPHLFHRIVPLTDEAA